MLFGMSATRVREEALLLQASEKLFRRLPHIYESIHVYHTEEHGIVVRVEFVCEVGRVVVAVVIRAKKKV